MRISGDFSRIIGEYNKNSKINRVANTQSVASKKDVASISSSAKDYAVARKALKEVSDVRQDKINELTQKYADGTYNVSGSDVADKLIAKMFDSKA